MVAMDAGGYFRRVFSVKPGNPLIKSFLSACSRVEKLGENRAACTNATRSDGDAEPIAALHVCSWLRLLSLVSTCHNMVLGFRVPVSTNLLS